MTRKVWELASNSLPVVPSFMLRKDSCPYMVYGAIRGPRSSNLWTWFGCNVSSVPEFCGGLYLTATNVAVQEFNTTYANTRQRDMWAAMPSTDDYFDWEWATERASHVELGAWSRWQNNGTTERARTAQTLEKIAGLSLGTRILSISAAYRRMSINFWDTTEGSTRLYMKWMYDALAGGVHWPDSLLSMHADHQHFTTGVDAEFVNSDCGNWTTTVWPGKYITGMYLRNANSGNMVACSTLQTSLTARRASKKDEVIPPPVNIIRAGTTQEMFQAAYRGITYAPNRFYPM